MPHSVAVLALLLALCASPCFSQSAKPDNTLPMYGGIPRSENAESSFTTANIINMFLLLATTLGALGVFWQVRASARTQRAMFLKDLYLRLRTDKDIADAFYAIEYGKFHYTNSFHSLCSKTVLIP